MGPYEVLAEVNELWRANAYRPGLVVVTGGEPFRQDLDGLFNVLVAHDYYVQVETNGTLAPTVCYAGAGWTYTRTVKLDERHGVYVVCSPKTGKLNPMIHNVACAMKYVVRAGCVLVSDGLPLSALDHPSSPYPARPMLGYDGLVYVQPLDSQDPIETKRTQMKRLLRVWRTVTPCRCRFTNWWELNDGIRYSR